MATQFSPRANQLVYYYYHLWEGGKKLPDNAFETTFLLEETYWQIFQGKLGTGIEYA